MPQNLRSLAQQQLHGPFVKFTKPHTSVSDGVLRFNFGSVSANADLAIVLQLRVELLREWVTELPNLFEGVTAGCPQ